MKAVRFWSIRNAGWLKNCYALLEGTLAFFNPLLKAIGHDRLEKAYVLAGVGRLAGTEDQKQEGVDLCVDLIEQVREVEGVSGVHTMAYRMEDRTHEIVTRTNALGGREPWRPAA